MSNRNFIKGECHHCAGHLEFPADAAGEDIICPHCSEPTELAVASALHKPAWSRKYFIAAVVGVAVVGGLLAALVLAKKTTPENSSPAIVIDGPMLKRFPVVQTVTNQFAIAAIKLEKTPGNSLVYVTGKILNLSDLQRFGVKVEFGLFDTNDNLVGKATDYQPVLEPRGDWHCKALVMDSKASSAKFNSIHEDQQ